MTLFKPSYSFQELHQAVWTSSHHQPSANGPDLYLQMTERSRIRFSDSTGSLTPLKFPEPNWTTLWTSTSQSRHGWDMNRMSMTTARRESRSTSCVMLMEKVSRIFIMVLNDISFCSAINKLHTHVKVSLEVKKTNFKFYQGSRPEKMCFLQNIITTLILCIPQNITTLIYFLLKRKCIAKDANVCWCRLYETITRWIPSLAGSH